MAEEQKPVKSEASDAVQLGEEMSSTISLMLRDA